MSCRLKFLLVRHWLAGLLAAAASLSALAAGPGAPTSQSQVAPESVLEIPAPDFWRRRRDGWFWYREEPPKLPVPVPTAKPREGTAKEKSVAEFENFQQRLEELRKVAIVDPTPDNVRAYMVYERLAFKQAAVFAEMQQALNWVDPVFAEDSANIRPVNSAAMHVWDQQRREGKREFMARLAKTHGLYFFIRGDCPYCHVLAPLVKRFAQETGFTIFPISLDGRGNTDYPQPVADNGIAARMGIKMVPALVLAQPSSRDYQIVSFGVVTDEELMDRIYALMNEKRMSRTRQSEARSSDIPTKEARK